MGATLGGALASAGHTVLCALEGRSPETARRAREHRIEDAGSLPNLAARCTMVISVCPPSAAQDVAESMRGFGGLYVDANAVSPATARDLWRPLERFVDASIIGPPPVGPATTRLYFSGAAAQSVAALFDGTNVEVRIIGEQPGRASALKMAHAGWSKGSSALLLACRALARADHVDEELLREWSGTAPDLRDLVATSAHDAARKGWRFAGEMEELASAMDAAGLPEGFHLGAAKLFRTFSQLGPSDDPLERFLGTIRPPRPEARATDGPGVNTSSRG
jgi:3-hydroxyisobutyrate dehydrogenase-like beta-hydroxyacid dehydrogenase